MQLTDVQKQAIAQWVKEGSSLSDVQKRIQTDFGVAMTYLDVRFLVIDLNVQLKDKKVAPKAAPAASAPLADPAGADALDGQAGGVSVDVDRIVKPGAVVSGTVTFSDGVVASWVIDASGRLAIDSGKRKGYRPSQRDVTDFQAQLQRVLEKQGF
jgi:hypothetical protein